MKKIKKVSMTISVTPSQKRKIEGLAKHSKNVSVFVTKKLGV